MDPNKILNSPPSSLIEQNILNPPPFRNLPLLKIINPIPYLISPYSLSLSGIISMYGPCIFDNIFIKLDSYRIFYLRLIAETVSPFLSRHQLQLLDMCIEINLDILDRHKVVSDNHPLTPPPFLSLLVLLFYCMISHMICHGTRLLN